MYVRVEKKGSRCKLYLAETYRTDGRGKQRKLYLGTLPSDVVPLVKKALEGRLEDGGTTLDSWRAYALWFWSRALREARREGDVERSKYARYVLSWLFESLKGGDLDEA